MTAHTTEEYVDAYLEDVADIAGRIDRGEIKKAIEILYEAWRRGSHVYFMGCGGSAATASHFAADLSKTAIVPGKRRFKALSLVDNAACITAWTNDEGWDSVFQGQIENFMQPGDVAVGISVHGGKGKASAGAWSRNITKAMQYAKDNGGRCIGIAGFDGGAFKELCDACIVVPKESTALVVGFHGDIQHMIVFRLREMIAEGR